MAKRVIIVDDSKTTRDMVVFTLRRASYEVVTADDGKQAMALLSSAPVDCVITDLNMPVMDGIDLIRGLRSSRAHRDIPILLLTTESEAARKEEGKQAGANGWLNKPFHPQKLVEVVGTLLA